MIEMVCWHCGHVDQVATGVGREKVVTECPDCKGAIEGALKRQGVPHLETRQGA